MNRRGFLQSILAAGVAPAFVGSSILMPVRKLVEPEMWFTPSGSGATTITMQSALWAVNSRGEFLYSAPLDDTLGELRRSLMATVPHSNCTKED
jgi:hypothetical protein